MVTSIWVGSKKHLFLVLNWGAYCADLSHVRQSLLNAAEWLERKSAGGFISSGS